MTSVFDIISTKKKERANAEKPLEERNQFFTDVGEWTDIFGDRNIDKDRRTVDAKKLTFLLCTADVADKNLIRRLITFSQHRSVSYIRVYGKGVVFLRSSSRPIRLSRGMQTLATILHCQRQPMRLSGHLAKMSKYLATTDTTIVHRMGDNLDTGGGQSKTRCGDDIL